MPMTRRPLLETATEDDVAAYVLGAARAGGWMRYHTRDSRRSPAGFPDEVLVHPTRRLTVFAELKGYDARGRLGRPTPDQVAWLEALRAAGQFAYLWAPLDQDLIDAVLLAGHLDVLPPLPPATTSPPRSSPRRSSAPSSPRRSHYTQPEPTTPRRRRR